MPEVSIIVPIYNVETYLIKCINSILKQTFVDFQLVLIDDGSTDKSPQICDRFAKKDNRIMVIHKENGGVSSARNVGIDNSVGKYIMFVDSDDWLPHNAVNEMLSAIKAKNTDFCCGSVVSVGSVHNINNKCLFYDIVEKNDKNRFLGFVQQIYCGPWAKLYKSSLIKQNGIYFPEKIKFSEDAIFIYKYLQQCRSVSSVDSCVYFYNRINTNSATSKYYPEINLWQQATLYELKRIFVDVNYKINAYIAKEIVLIFELCLRHHAWSNETNEKIIDMIKEACQLFKDDVKWAQGVLLQEENEIKNIIDTYSKYIDNSDFNGLLKMLREQNQTSQSSKIKQIIRNFAIFIRKIFIFGL